MKNKILILTFVILSCNFNSYKMDFVRVKREFGKQLTNHFPENIKDAYSFSMAYPTKLIRYKTCGVKLVTKISKQNLTKINAQQIINSQDKCALIVSRLLKYNRDLNKESEDCMNGLFKEDTLKYNKVLAELKSNCDSLSLPIPNFSGINGVKGVETNGVRLTKDYTLYTLEAKPGKYVEEEYLTQGCGLPKNGEMVILKVLQ